MNGFNTHDLLVTGLGLSAAAFFAAMALVGRQGMQKGDAVTGAMINIGTATGIFLVVVPFVLKWEFWLSPAVWIFAAIGVLRPSITNMLGFEGSKRLGPTVATTLEATSPLWALLGGVVLLSERVTPGIVVGALGVVGGVMLLSLQRSGKREWPLWTLSIPLLAALMRAGAHVGARWGLEMLPSVVFSGLVAYLVSFAVSLVMTQLRRGGIKGNVTRESLRWFGLAGLCNAGAIFSLNSALKLGSVVQVSPITATYPLFTLLFSALFYRKENITLRKVIAVLVVVPSIALITLSR